MSIFSRIFGLQSKSVDKTESGSPGIIRIGEFEPDGYDELVKQQGFASTWCKFKVAQEQTKQE